MLYENHISNVPNAKVLVLFGGNPARRHEIITHLRTIDGLTIYGTLSEQEGLSAIRQLPQTNLVLIGGRYTPEQRKRIKAVLAGEFPHIKITEPGVDYPYDETEILKHIKALMQ